MKIRDRITELRRVKAGELLPNPQNWRTHPQAQQDALKGILAEVGYASALLARELPTGQLQLIDGHLRAETTPDAEVPVLVLDVSESEAKKLLATFDPLGAMAEANTAALDALLREVETSSQAVGDMLTALAEEHGVIDVGEAALPDLPSGGKEPFQQMTFTLHDEQAGIVNAALNAAKQAGGFDGPNENSNGNALHRIAEAYLGSS